MTPDLVSWLRAQLDEDERVARTAPPGDWTVWLSAEAPERTEEAMAAHIVRWDRTRVLAEVAAKRRILELHGASSSSICDHCSSDWYVAAMPCLTIRLLAAPYSGRPGWDPSWEVKEE